MSSVPMEAAAAAAVSAGFGSPSHAVGSAWPVFHEDVERCLRMCAEAHVLGDVYESELAVRLDCQELFNNIVTIEAVLGSDSFRSRFSGRNPQHVEVISRTANCLGMINYFLARFLRCQRLEYVVLRALRREAHRETSRDIRERIRQMVELQWLPNAADTVSGSDIACTIGPAGSSGPAAAAASAAPSSAADVGEPALVEDEPLPKLLESSRLVTEAFLTIHLLLKDLGSSAETQAALEWAADAIRALDQQMQVMRPWERHVQRPRKMLELTAEALDRLEACVKKPEDLFILYGEQKGSLSELQDRMPPTLPQIHFDFPQVGLNERCGAHGIVTYQPLRFGHVVSLYAVKWYRRADVRTFFREAWLLSDGRHPLLVPAVAWGFSPDGRFLALALDCQIPLEKRLPDLPLAARVRLCAELAEWVAYSHSQDLLHCDLKLDNLLIDLNGTLRVCDLSLARRAGMQSVVPGAGTRFYLAPEQHGDVAHHTNATDVFQMGVTMWEILTHQTASDAFHRIMPLGTSSFEISLQDWLQMDPRRRFPIPEELCWLAGTLYACMAPQAAARPTAAAVHQRLRQHLSLHLRPFGVGVNVTPPPVRPVRLVCESETEPGLVQACLCLPTAGASDAPAFPPELPACYWVAMELWDVEERPALARFNPLAATPLVAAGVRAAVTAAVAAATAGADAATVATEAAAATPDSPSPLPRFAFGLGDIERLARFPPALVRLVPGLLPGQWLLRETGALYSRSQCCGGAEADDTAAMRAAQRYCDWARAASSAGAGAAAESCTVPAADAADAADAPHLEALGSALVEQLPVVLTGNSRVLVRVDRRARTLQFFCGESDGRGTAPVPADDAATGVAAAPAPRPCTARWNERRSSVIRVPDGVAMDKLVPVVWLLGRQRAVVLSVFVE